MFDPVYSRFENTKPSRWKRIAEWAGMALVSVPVVALIISIQTALRGWALTYLWAWFIVPMFGLPPLSVPYALGLCLVGGVVSNGLGKGSTIKDEYTTVSWWRPFITPFIVLFAGWVITKFI